MPRPEIKGQRTYWSDSGDTFRVPFTPWRRRPRNIHPILQAERWGLVRLSRNSSKLLSRNSRPETPAKLPKLRNSCPETPVPKLRNSRVPKLPKLRNSSKLLPKLRPETPSRNSVPKLPKLLSRNSPSRNSRNSPETPSAVKPRKNTVARSSCDSIEGNFQANWKRTGPRIR
jgi:hypothetical protein